MILLDSFLSFIILFKFFIVFIYKFLMILPIIKFSTCCIRLYPCFAPASLFIKAPVRIPVSCEVRICSFLLILLLNGESNSFIPEITAPSIKLSSWIAFMLPPINEWSAVLVKLPELSFWLSINFLVYLLLAWLGIEKFGLTYLQKFEL